jgi:hypothetical protein
LLKDSYINQIQDCRLTIKSFKRKEDVMEQTIIFKNLEQLDFDPLEKQRWQDKLQNQTAIVFSSLKLAYEVGLSFVHFDLIPRVGIVEARKFPLIKTGPAEDTVQAMDEIITGIRDQNQETWFLVDNSRFSEIYDYIVNIYAKENPEVKIQDLRE